MYYGDHLKLVNYDERRLYDLGKIIGTTSDGLALTQMGQTRSEMLELIAFVLVHNVNASVKLLVSNHHEEVDDLLDEGFETIYLDEARKKLDAPSV